jgi:hypothetical protein
MRKGIDYSWGRPSPAAIKAAGYTFVCRYLSWDTTGKNLTKAEAQALSTVGIDVTCNWEYATKEALSGYSQGVRNAQEAQRQAIACGMPAHRPIYFSVDFDATPSQQGAINSYLDGIASVIGRDRCGAYGGYYVIKRLFDASKIRWGWQTYAWSGGQWDRRAQLRQVQNDIQVGGADCDADEALAEDFGQWRTGPSSGCEGGRNGFVDIRDDLSGTVARTLHLGSNVTVTLEYGTVAGAQRGWAKISGSTSPGDQVWMDWTLDGGHSVHVKCGPFSVDAAGHSKTSAAQTTSSDPKWRFRACGKRPALGIDSQCTDWW